MCSSRLHSSAAPLTWPLLRQPLQHCLLPERPCGMWRVGLALFLAAVYLTPAITAVPTTQRPREQSFIRQTVAW